MTLLEFEEKYETFVEYEDNGNDEWLSLVIPMQAIYNRKNDSIQFVNIEKLEPEIATDFAAAAIRFGLDNEIITPNKE